MIIMNKNINAAGEAAEMMCKKYGVSRVSEEVEHLVSLRIMAKKEKDSFDEYTEAVKSATGKNFKEGIFANETHRRRALAYKEMVCFAAKEAARHSSIVRKYTEISILSRRYDCSKVKEAEELLDEFMVYATQVGVEAYLKMAK